MRRPDPRGRFADTLEHDWALVHAEPLAARAVVTGARDWPISCTTST